MLVFRLSIPVIIETMSTIGFTSERYFPTDIDSERCSLPFILGRLNVRLNNSVIGIYLFNANVLRFECSFW